MFPHTQLPTLQVRGDPASPIPHMLTQGMRTWSRVAWVRTKVREFLFLFSVLCFLMFQLKKEIYTVVLFQTVPGSQKEKSNCQGKQLTLSSPRCAGFRSMAAVLQERKGYPSFKSENLNRNRILWKALQHIGKQRQTHDLYFTGQMEEKWKAIKPTLAMSKGRALCVLLLRKDDGAICRLS